MEQTEQQKKRLAEWKRKVERDEAAWQAQRKKMDWREQLYEGTHTVKPVIAADREKESKCYHVRNVIQENIETMIDSHIPSPKVLPLRKVDEPLARELEALLRFFVGRRHLRVMNDLAERVNYIQGGVGYLVEWNNARRTPDGYGDVDVTMLHPKQIIPQDGVFTDVCDMDHITVLLAMTAQEVMRRFGVDVSKESETESGIRGEDGEVATVEEMVTLYVVYYRNDLGAIGMFAYVGDVVVADFEDYQARRVRRCKKCGLLDSYRQEWDDETAEDELIATGERKQRVHRCSYCEGTEFEDAVIDAEEVVLPTVLLTVDGKEIKLDAAKATTDENGDLHEEVQSFIPYYKPDLFPVVLQKNISKFGQLLGESDVDRMEDQQNTIKRLDQKKLDRLCKAGTKISLPSDTHLETNTEDSEVFRVDDAAKMTMIRTFEFSGDVSKLVDSSERAYEEARQQVGVTDSMQGRRDPTATSARAKEFAANKSEGRMESKRVMKREAWAKIYETIAKLFLANADVPQHLRIDMAGEEPEYRAFDRKHFLKIGEKGELYYETGFIFDCDDALLLGDSRESMWRELKEAFNGGALGDPNQVDTRILYWSLLEEQGYPGAGAIKRKLEEQKATEAQMQQAQPPVPMQQMPMGNFAGGQ